MRPAIEATLKTRRGGGRDSPRGRPVVLWVPRSVQPRNRASLLRVAQPSPTRNGGGGEGERPEVDPIIQGLLARLPQTGAVWPQTDRKLWLELLEGSFKLIYKEAPSSKTKPIALDDETKKILDE